MYRVDATAIPGRAAGHPFAWGAATRTHAVVRPLDSHRPDVTPCQFSDRSKPPRPDVGYDVVRQPYGRGLPYHELVAVTGNTLDKVGTTINWTASSAKGCGNRLLGENGHQDGATWVLLMQQLIRSAQPLRVR